MGFQTLFLKFHETIKLNNYDENAVLREKRDIILTKLRQRLSTSFTAFNQGSYAMNTGVQPLDGDYDIDVGLVFAGEPSTQSTHSLKKAVYDALSDHTQRVEWRHPCITVFYQKAREPIYHVDLPIYIKDWRGQLYLALGKEHSGSEQRRWEASDPQGFIELLRTRFSGEDALQLRRVIRALKRWKDVQFSNQGQAAPRGIALTVAAYHHFQPVAQGYAPSGAGQYDDLNALLRLVARTKSAFNWQKQLQLQMPVTPFDDVCRRMSEQQQREFYQRLEQLEQWLSNAAARGDVSLLRRAFGEDFPVN